MQELNNHSRNILTVEDSTLHTNTAVGAITRLQDMGVEPFLLSSSLTGVMAQRLVRTLFSDCRQAGELELERYVRQHSAGIRSNGIEKVLAGETSLDEVLRATMET